MPWLHAYTADGNQSLEGQMVGVRCGSGSAPLMMPVLRPVLATLFQVEVAVTVSEWPAPLVVAVSDMI